MKSFLKRFSVFFFATTTFALSLQPASALDVDVLNFKLENGMEVVVLPNSRAPVVTHMVWYRVGSADEVSGKTGLAHFLEHLVFKGTKKHPPGDFERLLESNGGDGNAFTSNDYTGYYQRIAADRLPLVMELEADRMQNLVLTDEIVAPELQVVREERRERTENDPSALLGEQLEAALYTAHPYGRPVVGWMAEVSQLSKDDALNFYRAHYTPANAVLVVAGDVTEEQVKTLANKYYGTLKNSFIPKPRARTPEPAPIAARRVDMIDPRAASPVVQRSYLTSSYASDQGNEAESLEVLSEILGGGSQSRLYKRLVVEKKIASYAGAYYSGGRLDSGSFGFYGAPNTGVALKDVEAAIDAELALMIKDGPTQVELDKARARMLAEQVYALDNQASLARLFGEALTTGSTVEDVLQRESRFAKLVVSDIQKAAAASLQIKRSVTGTLLPVAN